MNDYGYGAVDEVVKETGGSNRYLTLQYDKPVSLRITCEPKYVLRHYLTETRKYAPHTGEKCELCDKGNKKSAQWGWIVIDRTDKQVKIFKAPNQVALEIRDITKLIGRDKQPVWGDPRTFDIKVTKKKAANGFDEYSVEPDANNVEPLTAAEKHIVAEANLDLEKDMQGSKNSEHVGNYGGATNLETAPDGGVDPNDIPDNLGQEEGEDGLPF